VSCSWKLENNATHGQTGSIAPPQQGSRPTHPTRATSSYSIVARMSRVSDVSTRMLRGCDEDDTCLNGRAPSYLSDHCTPLSAGTRRHLRSTNRNLLAVPRHRLNTYGGRAYAVAGPTVWNRLPDFIRDPSISTDSFRRLLKTYLFARY